MKIAFLQQPLNIKIEVVCPACGFTQKEYSALDKTTCRACGQPFWIKPKVEARRPSRPKPQRREVHCHVCGELLRIPKDALSWQCLGCSTHLDVSNHVITGEHPSRILTYGDVVVKAGGHVTAARLEAGSLRLAGRISARVLCHHEIHAEGKAKLLAGAKAARLFLAEGGELHTEQTVEVRDATILGSLHAKQLIVTGHLHLGPRASLVAMRIQFASLLADPGSYVRAKANTLPPKS